MSRRPRIAILGSINMDLVVRCSHLPSPGETLIAESAVETPGGKGANQAVAVARSGGDALMVGRVGDDAFANRLLDQLASKGVDTSQVSVTESCSSGVAIVSVDDHGENSIIVIPGANSRLSPQDVQTAADTIRAADLLLVQLEVPTETVLAAVHVARSANIRVIFDPAPVPAVIPADLLHVDLLCPNQSEASALLEREIATVDQARDAVAELHRRGVRYPVITLGDSGAVMFDGRTTRWIEPHPVQAVDSTAAGDAFAGALAVAWAENDDLHQAIKLACAAGAISASRQGAQPSMPGRSEIETLLRKTK